MHNLIKIMTIENVIQAHPIHSQHIQDHYRYCPICGVWLRKKQIVIRYVCSNCRHFIPEDSQFCAFCGLEFSGMVEEKRAFRRLLTDEEYSKATEDIEL